MISHRIIIVQHCILILHLRVKLPIHLFHKAETSARRSALCTISFKVPLVLWDLRNDFFFYFHQFLKSLKSWRNSAQQMRLNCRKMHIWHLLKLKTLTRGSNLRTFFSGDNLSRVPLVLWDLRNDFFLYFRHSFLNLLKPLEVMSKKLLNIWFSIVQRSVALETFVRSNGEKNLCLCQDNS